MDSTPTPAAAWLDAFARRRWFRLTLLLAVVAVALIAGVQAAREQAIPQGLEVGALGDVDLYRSVAHAVSRGESYYEAAAAMHRARDYPLQPFYAVRPPTLASLHAALPAAALLALAWLLLMGAVAVWFHRLRDSPPIERAAALVLLALAGAPIISPVSIHMHEVWLGLLLTLALGIEGERRRLAQLLFVALALMVREFAAAFLALMLFRATLALDRKGVAAIVAVALGAAALFLLHREMVMAVSTAADGVSQGWLGLEGPIGFVRSLALFSGLSLLPLWAACALAFLPLLGWSTLRREPMTALLWFGGFGLVIAVAARPDNGYWIVTLLPAYAMGLAFVPRFFAELLRPRA